MNDVVSVSAPTAEELRAELRARVVSLEAENARLRAEVDTLSKGLCAQADNAVEAEKVESRLRAEVEELQAKLKLLIAAGQEVGNQWRILHEHYGSVNAEVARYRTMLREVVPERDRLRAEVEIAYKSRDEAVERANRLEFHDAQEQRGAAEAPPKPAPETGPSAREQAHGLVAMLLDLWPNLEDDTRRALVDRLADGYCLSVFGCGCNDPRCQCENDD